MNDDYQNFVQSVLVGSKFSEFIIDDDLDFIFDEDTPNHS